MNLNKIILCLCCAPIILTANATEREFNIDNSERSNTLAIPSQQEPPTRLNSYSLTDKSSLTHDLSAKRSGAAVRPRKTHGKNNPALRNKIASQLHQNLGRLATNKRSKFSALISKKQIDQLQKLRGNVSNKAGISIAFDAQQGTVSWIKADRLTSAGLTTRQRAQSAQIVARNFLNDNRSLLKLNQPDHELVLSKEQTDASGKKHIAFQQAVKGIPIWGKHVNVHLNANNEVYLFQGRYNTSIDLNTTPTLSATDAERIVITAEGGQEPINIKSTLMVYIADNTNPRLVYQVDILADMDKRWLYFIDAQSGTVVHRNKNIHHSHTGTLKNAEGTDLSGVKRQFKAWSDNGLNYLLDPSFPLAESLYDPISSGPSLRGDTIIYDAKNSNSFTSGFAYSTSTRLTSGWDATAVSAMHNTRQSYDYFKNTFNRHGIDDNGMNNNIVIHFGDQMANAFWNGTYLVYGDGDSVLFSSLSKSLDVAAHEMSHGVIEHSAKLIYQNQSGALNESFADFFGAMVDRDDWLMGEDITLTSPRFLRSMANPEQAGQPNHMDEYVNLPNTKNGDWGGVHINSGIPNRAAYLIAEGLSTENLGTSIGREKTEQIYYRALTLYLFQSADFLDARRALVQSAEDLYGSNSLEQLAVDTAWDSVGVIEGLVSEQDNKSPSTGETLSGADFMASLFPLDTTYDSDDEHLTIYYQHLPSPFEGYDPKLDFGPINPPAIKVRATRPEMITDEFGSYVLYVGIDDNKDTNLDGRADADIYQFNIRTGQTTLITNHGDIWSIAISPDLRYIAYTLDDGSNQNIYIIDLVENKDYTYPVLSLGATEEIGNTIYFADSISFDYTSRKLVFDALNCVSIPDNPCTPSGGGYQYWSIGIMDVANHGQVSYPIPNSDPAIDVGYPRFAYNSNQLITADVHDYRTATPSFKSVIFNLQHDKSENEVTTVITYPQKNWGTPSFWGDDDFITVQHPDISSNGRSALRVPLTSNWFGNTSQAIWLINGAAGFPIMHRQAIRTIVGQLESDKTLLNFGNVDPGQEIGLDITVSNNSDRDVAISRIELNNALFTHNTSNTTLPKNSNIQVNVRFKPQGNPGTQVTTLTFHNDSDDGPLSVSLTGTITGTPSASGGGGSLAIFVALLAALRLYPYHRHLNR